MNIIQAIILGIIQGLTEFLPVSSTAHLTIAGTMMNLISPEHPEEWTAFIAVIQLGTLAAVLIYFAKDIIVISKQFLGENLIERKKFSEQSLFARMGWFIIIGSMPIATIGLALKKIIEGNLTKDLTVIACSLIGLALILEWAERRAKFTKALDTISWKDALIIGLAQTMALIPGSSRSGTTITAGLFLGMTRETAARFSFLLSIPAVFASGLLELFHSLKFMHGQDFTAMSVATIVSGITGYATIAFLLKYLRSHTTKVFIWYRVILGLLLLTNFVPRIMTLFAH